MTSITEETDNALSHQSGQTSRHPVSMTDRNLHSGTPGPRLHLPTGKLDQHHLMARQSHRHGSPLAQEHWLTRHSVVIR